MVSALKKQNLYYVGTIRNNRLHGAPLKSEKELKKEGRGAYHSVVETTNNLSLVRWLDNKCVTVVSSYLGAEPADSIQRYDRSKKEHISVDRPHPIGVYNKAMGRVDLMDMMCTLYKYPLRSCFIRFLFIARVRSLEWNAYTVSIHWPQQRRMVYFGIVETNRAANSSAHRKIATFSEER